MKMRLLSLLLAIILTFSLLPQLSTPVSAAFENTYVNTGNQAADIIGVALTQVGYKEGWNNYTKYGEWYGLPNSPWCGMFVSWCANQAGIPTSVLAKYARSNPAGYGLTELSGYSYRPQPGDLFFYRSYSHVGIVYYVEGDYFYSLEGNTGSNSDSVCIRKRLITDYVYGSPNYRGGAEHSYTTHYETSHPHKEYKVCGTCSDTYYTGNTRTDSSCTQCIQESCTHSFNAWTSAANGTHTRKCSICDKVETKDHNWNSGTVTLAPTCAKYGSKDQTCIDCGAKRTITLSKTEDHEFTEKTYVDDTEHIRTCDICGVEEVEQHTENDHWQTDDYFHWYECEECNDRYSQEKHDFPDGCGSACLTCGYISSQGHSYDSEFFFDESGHWHICDKCGQEVGRSEHNFSAECDETCDDCGYTRQTVHTASKTFQSNDAGHWHTCDVCGKTLTSTNHVADTAAADWEDQLCLDCGHVLRSADAHQHSYDVIYHDQQSHWGVCACGHVLPSQTHTWSVKTQSCSVCGLNTQVIEETPATSHIFYWAAIVLGSTAIVTTAAVLLLKKRKTAEIPA